jgi:hypothetical protein
LSSDDTTSLDELADPQKLDENPSLKLLIKFQRLLIAELYALGINFVFLKASYNIMYSLESFFILYLI